MHETAGAFGYPETLVAEYEHWVVLLRPAQVTAGALVLVVKKDVRRLADLTAAAFTEMHATTGDIERTLQRLFDYDRINYLCLMMRDPQAHFHVLPRYAEPRTVAGVEFVDAGWPGPPALATAPDLDETALGALHALVRDAWPT